MSDDKASSLSARARNALKLQGLVTDEQILAAITAPTAWYTLCATPNIGPGTIKNICDVYGVPVPDKEAYYAYRQRQEAIECAITLLELSGYKVTLT